MPLLSVLLILCGLAIFLYPTVSNYFAERNFVRAIKTYDNKVAEMDTEAINAAWQEAKEYNENLSGDPVHDPFVPGSGYALPDNYESVLNLNGDGIMGYIEIPKIDVMLPIYHGADEQVLQNGVGHIQQTALPIGGTRRNAVLSAHRGLPSAELFTHLDKMKIGDYFYIYVLDKTLAYKVVEIKTIKPTELESLNAYADEDRVTLLTCTPYAVNTHRLLVIGERTEYIAPEETKYITDTTVNFVGIDVRIQQLGIIIGAAIVVLIIFIVLIIWLIVKKRKKRRRADETDDIINGS